MVLPLKRATTFDLDGLPPEICLDIRDIILDNVSPNEQELILGDAMYPGKNANILWKPYSVEEAEHKRNVCEELVPLKMPLLLSPRLSNRAYFGKRFKFASTTDLANFLKGIGPVARGLLRKITVSSYLPTSAEQAFKLLADAENLETVCFTAICMAEAGCRRIHKRYPPTSIYGKPFLDYFSGAIRLRSRYNRRCLIDVLRQRPVLRFDPHIAAYDSAFDSYLDDQPLYPSTMSLSDVSAFRRFWASQSIPLQQ